MHRIPSITLLAAVGIGALACSSGAKEGSEGAAGSTAISGSGGTTVGSGGTDPGSGGTTVGSGGSDPGSGGSDLGSGGSDPGVGGAAVGSGGTTVGSGGTDPGSGGSDLGSGGSDPGVGGAAVGSGGTAVGSGGSDPGTGGSDPGVGGTDPGVGGTDPGTGGTDPGAGGTDPGAGGTDPGAGGSDPGVGGTDPGAGGTGTGGAGGSPSIRLPTANAQFDYQIGGGYTPPAGVEVVSRDREDSPAAGLYNICYVNGFQIQPHEESWWESNHPDLILRDANGDPVIDSGWDEMLVDVTTPAKREAAASIIGEWIAQCAADGFDAVEIDNLDSYSRSDGLIAQSDNIAFMGMLADIAHANGLAAAQKNSTEFLDSVATMHTDFAIAEECNAWNECADYTSVYGNLVFVIEYSAADFNAGCTDFPELSIVLRNVAVSTPSSGNYVYDAC